MSTVKYVHLDTYPINDNDHNTRMVFLNKLMQDDTIGIYFKQAVNTSKLHDVQLEEHSSKVKNIVNRNVRTSGLTTYINAYKDRHALQSLFPFDEGSVYFDHAPDKLLLAVAQPYNKIVYYSKKKIAIPPSQWILQYKIMPIMKLNLPHLQRKYPAYSPNDKIALMRHAMCVYYTLAYHKEYEIQEKDVISDSTSSSSSDDSDDDSLYDNGDIQLQLQHIPQNTPFESAGAKLEEGFEPTGWDDTKYNLNQFDELLIKEGEERYHYKITEIHDNGYFAKKIEDGAVRSGEFYINSKDDYDIIVTPVKQMTWELLEECNKTEDLLEKNELSFSASDENESLEGTSVLLKKSVYNEFKFDKIRENVKKVNLLQRLTTPIVGENDFKLSICQWIENKNTLFFDLKKELNDFGLQEYIIIGELFFSTSDDKLFTKNALLRQVYGKANVDATMELALQNEIENYIKNLNVQLYTFEELKNISNLKDSNGKQSTKLKMWWKEKKKEKLQREIQTNTDSSLFQILQNDKFKYIHCISDEVKQKDIMVKFIVHQFQNYISNDDAIYIRDTALNIIKTKHDQNIVELNELQYIEQLESLQKIQKGAFAEDKYWYQIILDSLYDEDKYLDYCIQTEELNNDDNSDSDFELFEPSGPNMTKREKRYDQRNKKKELMEKKREIVKRKQIEAEQAKIDLLQTIDNFKKKTYNGLVLFMLGEYGKVSTDNLFNAFKNYIQFGNKIGRHGDEQNYYGETYKDFFEHFSMGRRSVKLFNDPVRYKYTTNTSVFNKDKRTFLNVVENVEKINVLADLKNLNSTSSSNNWNTIVRFALYEKYNFFIPTMQQYLGEQQWSQLKENGAFEYFVYDFCMLYTLIFNKNNHSSV